MILRQSGNLYLDFINIEKGFGVFTNSIINKGESVEICYCLPFNPENMFLRDYLFNIPELNEDFLPLGYGSIYNHSFEPNLYWRVMDLKLRTIEFIALKNIEIDEELTHNYGTKWWNKRKENMLI